MINEECIVTCPAGTTNFQLVGNLVFIQKNRLGNISSILAKSKTSDSNFNIDFSSLGWQLLKNWWKILLVIIFVVSIFVIIDPLLPIVTEKLLLYFFRIRQVKTKEQNNQKKAVQKGKTKQPFNQK